MTNRNIDCDFQEFVIKLIFLCCCKNKLEFNYHCDIFFTTAIHIAKGQVTNQTSSIGEFVCVQCEHCWSAFSSTCAIPLL